MLPPGLDAASLRACMLDLDGTIVADAVLVAGAATAVASLQASGIRAVIATGRMLTSARRYASQLAVSAPLICYQGALIADPHSGAVLHHQPLHANVAADLVRAVSDLGYDPLVFIDEQVYTARKSPVAERYARSAGVGYRVVHDLADWLASPVTKIVTAGEPAEMDTLRDELLPGFGRDAFIAKSLPYYLEMAAPGVSKADGAARVAGLLGVTAEQCMAFGDGENDIDLIEWAGFGVAVAGGFPHLIEVADWVCPALAEDGVPRALRAIVDARRGSSSA